MANMFIFSLLVILVSIASAAPTVNSITCPNQEVILPCTCKRVAYGLQTVCANFQSSDILKRVFKILRDYRVHTVLLHNLFIEETLPNDLFDGLQIKEIKIEKCKLRFDHPAFEGLDSTLYVLNVAQHSLIKSSESFSLAKLTKLNELNVQSNTIQIVSDSWLNDKVPNLSTVVLDFNDINVVEDHAFSSLPQLRTISLADNRIKVVKRSMFPKPATFLRRIDISFNSITSLPTDFFEGMPSLKEVILSGNELQTLPELTWSPVWERLTQLFVLENKFECNEEMAWIRKIKHPRKFEGNCASPKNLANQPIKEVYKTT